MESLNLELFGLLNAPAHPAHWMLSGAYGVAEWVVYGAVVWMVLAWISTNRAFRHVLLDALLVMLVGLALNQLIGLVIYHPRPFEMHVGHQFMPHSPETSFPSDHGTVMFALAMTLLLNRASRLWGAVFFVLALFVAWSRIYLGIHFPFDMLGAFVVALVSCNSPATPPFPLSE